MIISVIVCFICFLKFLEGYNWKVNSYQVNHGRIIWTQKVKHDSSYVFDNSRHVFLQRELLLPMSFQENEDDRNSWLKLNIKKVSSYLSATLSFLKSVFQSFFSGKRHKESSSTDLVPESKLLNFPSVVLRQASKVNKSTMNNSQTSVEVEKDKKLLEARRYVQNLLDSIGQKRRAGTIQSTTPSATAHNNVTNGAVESHPSITMKGEHSLQNTSQTIQHFPPTILDLSDDEFLGKLVLVRCNFNVSLIENNVTGDIEILDDYRIQNSLPTLQFLLNRGAKVLVAAHIGEPTGTGYDAKLSLAPVAKHLSDLLNRPVPFTPDCIGLSVDAAIANMKQDSSQDNLNLNQSVMVGNITVLENVMFYAEEMRNDDSFAKAMSKNVDIFVNDYVGSTHLSHASITGILKHVPKSVFGISFAKDLELKSVEKTNSTSTN